jgi:hypothetical protein
MARKRYRFEDHLTVNAISVSPVRMGRPKLDVKPTQVRLTDEVRRRIEALVGPNRMAEFIREAVQRELERREAEPEKP